MPLCLATTRRKNRSQKTSKGFGVVEAEKKEPVPTSNQKIYSMPGLYDMAFGYRNYEEEVNFLVGQHKRVTSQSPSRILEVAAGPARHTLTALQSSLVQQGIALDNSPEMVEYGKETAAHELPVDTDFIYVEGDMTSFQIPEPVDSTWLLLGSLQHLTENEQVVDCFQCIHNRAFVPSPWG